MFNVIKSNALYPHPSNKTKNTKLIYWILLYPSCVRNYDKLPYMSKKKQKQKNTRIRNTKKETNVNDMYLNRIISNLSLSRKSNISKNFERTKNIVRTKIPCKKSIEITRSKLIKTWLSTDLLLPQVLNNFDLVFFIFSKIS